jgi:uncharacterized phage protein (TIGR01671 family)
MVRKKVLEKEMKIPKFRVWHKIVKYMADVEIINFNDAMAMICQNSNPMNSRWVALADCELMQYTGHDDKNKIPIYEGDILNIDNDGDEYITHVRDEQGTLAVDVIGYEYNYTSLGWIDDWCEKEVIGNIHQNPELLKDKPNE